MVAFKRILAVSIAAVMLLLFVGCNQNVPKADAQIIAGQQDSMMTAGVYRAFQVDVVNEAVVRLGVTGDELFDKEIDGQRVEQWVADQVESRVKRAYTIEQKLKELGRLPLTKEEESELAKTAEEAWNNEGAKEYYAESNLAQGSFYNYMYYRKLEGMFSETLYGPGGDQEVSDEDLRTYVDETYYLTNFMWAIPGVASNEQKQAVVQAYEGYAVQINAGQMTWTQMKTAELNRQAQGAAIASQFRENREFEKAQVKSQLSVSSLFSSDVADQIEAKMAETSPGAAFFGEGVGIYYFFQMLTGEEIDAYVQSQREFLVAEVAAEQLEEEIESYTQRLNIQLLKEEIQKYSSRTVVVYRDEE